MAHAVHMKDMSVSEPANDTHDQRVVSALRRIIHAVDIHSRWMHEEYDITSSQLATLLSIAREGRTTIARIAREVHLTAGTLVGIIDRLEAKGLITRMRDAEDRRLVFLSLTDKGKTFVKTAPSLLQVQLAKALMRLPVNEQATIASSLERIAGMMETHVAEEPASGAPQDPPVL